MIWSARKWIIRVPGVIFLSLLLSVPVISSGSGKKPAVKRIYFTFTLHGNMNYDRYPASTIRAKFPETYQNILTFIAEHPDFKGQVQLSGQSFKTMQQVAPAFLSQVAGLHEKGQLDVTGTFYSEPVNVCMNGETNLLCAWLGTSVIRKELFQPSGFFLQEHAWNPQLPYILKKAGIDWVPVRVASHKRFKPFYAVGLDGTKITAIEEISSFGNYKAMIDNLPDNAIVLIGGDYEIPERFVTAYNEVNEINSTRKDVKAEWIRVSDYLKKVKPEGEVMINNSELAGIRGWDSYSRWTADPLDIEIHTLTKKAEASLLAAKIAVFAGTAFERSNGLQVPDPDLPVEKLESVRQDDGTDWDIEHASDYPDVEPVYLARKGRVSMLSRAEHLLAWAVNSDARGWWPLYERRTERMESFNQVISICDELIRNSLLPAAKAYQTAGSKKMLVLNAGKARDAVLEFKSNQPMGVFDGKDELRMRIYRQGNEYLNRILVSLPEYGYKILSLSGEGKVEAPEWKAGSAIMNGKISVTADGAGVIVRNGSRTFRLSLDPFQVKVLAETVYPDTKQEGWHDAVSYGEPKVSVCTSDLYPVLRIDWQPDWAVHFRQEYEIRNGNVHCKWIFRMPYPELIRKQGDIFSPSTRDLFRAEGLMARLETNEEGKVWYDVPFGITDQNYPSPAYVCMQDFALLQQNGHGVMMVAKTGSQAMQVNEQSGSLALALGASTAAGPLKNPAMNVEGLKINHEQPFISEYFSGEYEHEFVICPFEGKWEDSHMPSLAANLVNDLCFFQIQNDDKAVASFPGSSSFITSGSQDAEITDIDDRTGELILRLNNRGAASSGNIRMGKLSYPYELKPNAITEINLYKK